MTWRILIAFLTAGLAAWIVPAGEFTVLGQFCLPILALSVLDAVFSRLP